MRPSCKWAKKYNFKADGSEANRFVGIELVKNQDFVQKKKPNMSSNFRGGTFAGSAHMNPRINYMYIIHMKLFLHLYLSK